VNLYHYCLTGPLQFTDGTGLEVTVADPGDQGNTLKSSVDRTNKNTADGDWAATGYELRYLLKGDKGDAVVQDVTFNVKVVCDNKIIIDFTWEYTEWWRFTKNGAQSADVRSASLYAVYNKVFYDTVGTGISDADEESDGIRTDMRLCGLSCCANPTYEVTHTFKMYAATFNGGKAILGDDGVEFGFHSQKATLKACGKALTVSKLGSGGLRSDLEPDENVEAVKDLKRGNLLAEKTYKMTATSNQACNTPQEGKDAAKPKSPVYTGISSTGIPVK